MAHTTLKITTQDIARLTGLPIKRIKRELKEYKVDRDNLPDLIRFIYPRMLLSKTDPRKVWRTIQQEREQAKKARDGTRKESPGSTTFPHYRPPFQGKKLPTLADTEDLPQTFPEY